MFPPVRAAASKIVFLYCLLPFLGKWGLHAYTVWNRLPSRSLSVYSLSNKCEHELLSFLVHLIITEVDIFLCLNHSSRGIPHSMRKDVLPSIMCTAVSHFSHYAISPCGHIQFMTGIWLRLDEMLNCNQTPAILCSLHFGHLPLKKWYLYY